MLDDRDVAALALTSRLVDSTVTPLSAREFWAAVEARQPGEPARQDRRLTSPLSSPLAQTTPSALPQLLDRGRPGDRPGTARPLRDLDDHRWSASATPKRLT